MNGVYLSIAKGVRGVSDASEKRSELSSGPFKTRLSYAETCPQSMEEGEGRREEKAAEGCQGPMPGPEPMTGFNEVVVPGLAPESINQASY